MHMKFLVCCLYLSVSLKSIYFVDAKKHGSQPGSLSSFNMDDLEINFPPFSDDPLEETIWMLKSHFYKSHLYDDSFWQKAREEVNSYSNRHAVGQVRYLPYITLSFVVAKGLKHLMEKLGDRFSKFLPKDVIDLRQQSVKGESVGVGKCSQNTDPLF